MNDALAMQASLDDLRLRHLGQAGPILAKDIGGIAIVSTLNHEGFKLGETKDGVAAKAPKSNRRELRAESSKELEPVRNNRSVSSLRFV